ncbi:MAG TPA: capsule assembly Wzi family protein [Gemmatimonadaceae bacterium]|nr:capsule assembly Wzi family protein [Gemmatimonadaceae bacterium]
MITAHPTRATRVTRSLSRVLTAALLGAVVVRGAQAQATVSVEADDPILTTVDRLIAEGAIRTAVVGQRPWSRRELARLLAEARTYADSLAPFDSLRARHIRGLLGGSAAGYESADAATTRFLARLSSEAVVGGAGAREIPFGGTGQGPLGRIDAITNPLVERRLGRVYNDGSTYAIETAHRLQLGRDIAVALSPRVWLGDGADAVSACDSCVGTPDLRRARPEDAAMLRIAAVTLGARNVRLVVGRDHLLLGQSMFGGGLMLSDNAPALDMVRIASDAPFLLPWFLRRVGPMQATAFLADLGGDRDIPHARLAGWKLSLVPSPRVEWGVSVLSQQGGSGAPGASVAQRVADLLPLIDVLVLQDRDLLFSNKLAGLDARVRFPEARGLELYWEGVVDDFDIRRIGSSLTEDAAHVVGMTLARLAGDTKLRADLEARHTGLRFYQHEQFSSGLTVDRFILGDPLGPRARALAARITHDPGARSPLMLTWAIEQRSNDQYVVSAEEQTAAGWRFVKVEDRPEEIRQRALLTWMPLLDGRMLRGRLDLGWEHVRQPGFTAGTSDHGLLRIGLDARF